MYIFYGISAESQRPAKYIVWAITAYIQTFVILWLHQPDLSLFLPPPFLTAKSNDIVSDQTIWGCMTIFLDPALMNEVSFANFVID